MKNNLSKFLKEQRKIYKITQRELAEKSGISLRLIRDLEQGKETSRIDKVNTILKLFGFKLYPVNINDIKDI
ncbi:MAG: helix-turn-helix transcriptional regulator [Ignavibacteria bacterium]|nr:helix-turn-helix transcriptional regulator [Ignavibacteria bacterium]